MTLKLFLFWLSNMVLTSFVMYAAATATKNLGQRVLILLVGCAAILTWKFV